MILHNKKTGEIVYAANTSVLAGYRSLDALNEEWEDYKPVEPLIKNEKVRKAVRAWADFNGSYPIYCEDRCTLSYNHVPRIEFKDIVFTGLNDRPYNIVELCGEEE